MVYSLLSNKKNIISHKLFHKQNKISQNIDKMQYKHIVFCLWPLTRAFKL